jgi:hypothetical protein
MENKGQSKDIKNGQKPVVRSMSSDFVLEKGIFTNIFEKDIRRVYIYKKVERLAKAIHLVSPAFRNSPALRDRMDRVAVGMVDAAILPPSSARDALSRELLALSSVLSIARTGGLLSPMNAEMIAREAHQLLQEIASYEEPRLFLDDAPSLAELSKELAREAGIDRSVAEASRVAPVGKSVSLQAPAAGTQSEATERPGSAVPRTQGHSSKGQIKDTSSNERVSGRRDAIRSILERNGPSYIKDISTIIRDVSEKTIQRELQAMVEEGILARTGERRWTTYSLA